MGVRRGREGEAVGEQFLICFLSSIKTRYLLGEAMGKHCRIVIAIHLKERTIKKFIHKGLAQDKCREWFYLNSCITVVRGDYPVLNKDEIDRTT